MRYQKNRIIFVSQLLLGCCLLLPGCRKAEIPQPETSNYTPADDEFAIMCWNLKMYCLIDRDGDGEKNDPKPAQERAAIIETITRVNPAVLAIQEIGSQLVFEEFCAALAESGLEYEYIEYLHRGRQQQNMAVLSRFPFISRQTHKHERYTVSGHDFSVLRGFIDVDIQTPSGYSFRLLTAHLKSRIFHQFGQTEMRRNEARLLNKHVRAALKEHPNRNLLVVGDMNDTYQSAAIREVLGKKQRYLFDLRPQDQYGEVWTHFSAVEDAYSRIDYILVSRGLWPEVVENKTRVVRDENVNLASDHRPLVVVLRNGDLVPAMTMDSE